MEQGRLIIKKTKKGYAGSVKFADKEMPVPNHYKFQNDSMDGAECQFEKNRNGQIIRLVVNGLELFNVAQRQIEDNSNTRPNNQVMDCFALNKTKLPGNIKDMAFGDADNFALKLNKAARYEVEQKKFMFYKTNRNGPEYAIKFNIGALNIRDICQRHLHAVRALLGDKGKSDGLESLNFKPDWRLIVGLGNESVYETSMTLHHIYGVPFIPGQAVKGAVRSWVINEYFEAKEEDALKDSLFRFIFGGPAIGEVKASAGKMLFFDALPLTKPKIDVDIMNPHYQPYYSGDKEPGDYQDPVPIPFLTVVDTPFQFLVGIKEQNSNEMLASEKLGKEKPLQLTCKWLKKALELNGIGAKTAVGYGYMMQVVQE